MLGTAWTMERQRYAMAEADATAAMTARLARVAAGRDRQAFAELFLHFGPRIKSFMMRKGADADAAEDLVQETMIAVWNKAALYAADRGSVTTWVFTIARNLRIDRLRREAARHFTDVEDCGEEASDEPGSEELVMRRQGAGRVAAALAALPPEQREIIALSYLEDLPQSAIAARLSTPLGTVKSRMRLAYRRLRALLEESS
jgi:RNA polymerase sigma-70 factor (ECF subfamily)